MKKETEKKLTILFEEWSGEKVESCTSLSGSGSYRQYCRIQGQGFSALGVFNQDKKENTAFIEFTKHFLSKGLPVPKIFKTDPDNNIYLIEDLGDTTFFSFLTDHRLNEDFSDSLIDAYKKVIDVLPEFQITAGKDIDYSYCYPRSSFDKQSMLWDLNYFKYYFLKLAKIPFDEQKLEDDFQLFSDFMLETKTDYFLYRDFQSRNIMVVDDKPFFIDYQGGRKGALQYDIASLLYDAKANIPQQTRTLLLDYYLKVLENYFPVNKTKFLSYYYGYVLIRIMQALGAYGFRGYYEKKEHFLLSIPYAIENLTWILKNIEIPIKVPALMEVLHNLTQSDTLCHIVKKETYLKIVVTSFSFKKGLPQDESGNGGGFIFDCRALNNPGRYDEYKNLTGKDKKVIDFLNKESELFEFMNHVYGLIDKSVENYIERRFTNLMVNFGCTGGQHRSVLCTNMLAAHLKKKYHVKVSVQHRELDKINKKVTEQ